jgi:salicylate synthetase
MTSLQPTTIKPLEPLDPLAVTVKLLESYKTCDYYAYEVDEVWHIGIHRHASLVIDSDGKHIHRHMASGIKTSELAQDQQLNDVVRAFCTEYAPHGKIFGQVAFNFSAHIAGQSYIPGRWPLLSLMAPCIHVTISRSSITVQGSWQDLVEGVLGTIHSQTSGKDCHLIGQRFLSVARDEDVDDYQQRVTRAIAEIRASKYTKAIPSRVVNVPGRVDMLATLYHGRRANTPRRAFTFKQGEFQATGFSPELVLSVNEGTVFTEALAGTQSCDETEARALQNDPKEVMEHLIAVRGSIRRLKHICKQDSVVIRDFMTTVTRGNVRHLCSHISGSLLPSKDGWDSIRSNITVPALLKERNSEAIEAFEPYPRELYGGSVVMIDGPAFFEAALVLRSVFQDQGRQWLQAGAGVTALSDAVREFTETCEKLASVAPYLVAESETEGIGSFMEAA